MNEKQRFERRGRLIRVKGVEWRYRVGKGGSVIAYGEHGRRLCAGAWVVKGSSPDTFERGQHKRTSDGMVTPLDVFKWISRDEELS